MSAATERIHGIVDQACLAQKQSQSGGVCYGLFHGAEMGTGPKAKWSFLILLNLLAVKGLDVLAWGRNSVTKENF